MSTTARPLLLFLHEIHMDVLAGYASSGDDSDGPGPPEELIHEKSQSGNIQLTGRKRKALPGAADLLAGASEGLPMLTVLCLPGLICDIMPAACRCYNWLEVQS